MRLCLSCSSLLLLHGIFLFSTSGFLQFGQEEEKSSPSIDHERDRRTYFRLDPLIFADPSLHRHQHLAIDNLRTHQNSFLQYKADEPNTPSSLHRILKTTQERKRHYGREAKNVVSPKQKEFRDQILQSWAELYAKTRACLKSWDPRTLSKHQKQATAVLARHRKVLENYMQVEAGEHVRKKRLLELRKVKRAETRNRNIASKAGGKLKWQYLDAAEHLKTLREEWNARIDRRGNIKVRLCRPVSQSYVLTRKESTHPSTLHVAGLEKLEMLHGRQEIKYQVLEVASPRQQPSRATEKSHLQTPSSPLGQHVHEHSPTQEWWQKHVPAEINQQPPKSGFPLFITPVSPSHKQLKDKTSEPDQGGPRTIQPQPLTAAQIAKRRETEKRRHALLDHVLFVHNHLRPELAQRSGGPVAPEPSGHDALLDRMVSEALEEVPDNVRYEA